MILEDTRTAPASDVIENGRNDLDDDAGRAICLIAVDRSRILSTRFECTIPRWVERCSIAVDSIWRNAISERRGISISSWDSLWVVGGLELIVTSSPLLESRVNEQICQGIVNRRTPSPQYVHAPARQ